MGALYQNLARPLFFKLDPERAHEVTVDGLRALCAVPGMARVLASFNQLPSAAKPVELFGVRFPNRIGLAAGFDKNAVCWRAFEAFGFGHVEIGTVTFKAQPGNPKPRLFRYPEHKAVLNRMGFNNHGAQSVAVRLGKGPAVGERRIPLGVNIGKSKVAPLDKAVEDYIGSFTLLAEHADYVAINVSSPNTPDLRKLQEESRLRELLSELTRCNNERETKNPGSRKPILLKIAPDLSVGQLDDILSILSELHLDGIIATNTTMAREGPFADINQPGGISGAPICDMSTKMIAHIAKVTDGKLPIIGVGGITNPDTAAQKLDAGASIVQIYSGMIFEGPLVAKRVARALAEKMGDL
ncbi:quinone-dependent dihydroorotate dehydrogenase [Pelagicoccus sp. SDUM812003]|uniref:quinone-dependent dihydroorotate dehydrogenase n=1 Tax=Pelagicoccus sp. SDUM812003 TaxID=3041267 RepID=UPI00280DC8DF|nr:quinone-dependent dihydroorotate dehydrogenase [Pelagicoccus sp. SDUM812003]MDQ8204589.1 quinone-dependent dihydroorotate dehydrogenase [Pelagicoccus sp. SDUM812003]